MNLLPAELEILESGTQRLGIFFRLATEPAVRLWLGVWKIRPGINALDEHGETYFGLGTLLDVPRFQQLLNGSAERVEIALSGVTEEVLAIAMTNPTSVRGKTCAFGLALLDEAFALVGPVRWCRHFVADYVSIRRRGPAGPGEPATQIVALSVRSQLSGIRRPGHSYFSDYDQRVRSATDAFCERVHLYTRETTRTWPDF